MPRHSGLLATLLLAALTVGCQPPAAIVPGQPAGSGPAPATAKPGQPAATAPHPDPSQPAASDAAFALSRVVGAKGDDKAQQGTYARIEGRGFGSERGQVSIDSNQLAIDTWSDTMITAFVAADKAPIGPRTLSVTTTDGRTVSRAITVEGDAAPVLSGGGGSGGAGPATPATTGKSLQPLSGPHVEVIARPVDSVTPVAEPSAPASVAATAKIVTVSNTPGNNEVHLANADGTSLTRLTFDPADDLYPRFSTDRREIVWCSNRGQGTFQIYRMWADGSHPLQVTSGSLPATQPAFSPDGAKIAFVRWTSPGTSVIAVINRDGTGEVRLSPDGGQAFSPTWSPDGTKIAFGSNHANPAAPQLYTMNANGSALTALTAVNAQVYPVGGMDWSPDGTKIVYASYGADTTLGITVLNAAGGGRVELTNGGDFDPSWSPDGSKILFTTLAGGTSQLAVVNTDGSGRTTLTTGPATYAHADW